eukprot:gene12474-12608_t
MQMYVRRLQQPQIRGGLSRKVSVAALASSKVSVAELRTVAERAAAAGAEIVTAALDKPRNISTKDSGIVGDIVTETDKAAEAACIAAIQHVFPDHAILGEEGGLIGDASSDYLWCIDPLDGTCNFAHNYPGFCVSIGVLRHALPVAGCVIEFTGGPGGWGTRQYSGGRNLGSTVNGRPLLVSSTKKLVDALVATEFVHFEDLWGCLTELNTDFSQTAMGIRASGAAAVNLCHLAAGQIDAYYQYMLKPWDVAAGIVILEEAGGRVTTADGTAYSIFDRSLLATNDALYDQMLAKLEGPTGRAIREAGVKLGPANIPKGYKVRSGAQLE